MVGQHWPNIARGFGGRQSLPKAVQQFITILIVFENITPFNTANHDMVEHTWRV